MLRRAGVVAAGIAALSAVTTPVQANHLLPSLVDRPQVVEVTPNQGASHTAVLAPGSYRLEATGVIQWDADPNHRADAECTTFSSASDWRRNRFPVDGQDRAELWVDGGDVEWVPTDPDAFGCSTATVERDRTYVSHVHLDRSRTVALAWSEPAAAPDPSDDRGRLTVTVQPLRLGDLGEAVVGAVPGVAHEAVRFAGAVSVPVDGSTVGLPTRRDVRYVAVASGQYVWNGVDGGRADAECSTSSAGDLLFLPNRYPGDLLDLLVRDRALDDRGEPRQWAPVTLATACDPTHTYFASFLSESTFATFRVNDFIGSDNLGAMVVSLFAIDPPPADAAPDVIRPGTATTATAAASDPSGAAFSIGAGPHLVTVRGTWHESTVAGSVIDAECLTEPSSPRWPDATPIALRDRKNPTYDPMVPDVDATRLGDARVIVDGADLGPVHWVAPGGTAAGCDQVDHRYETFVQGALGGSTLQVTVGDFDGAWHNNEGALEVTVQPLGHHGLPVPVRRYVGTIAASARTVTASSLPVDPSRSHLLVTSGTFAYRHWSEADAACAAGRRAVQLRVQGAAPQLQPTGCQRHTNRYWVTNPSGASSISAGLSDTGTADNFGHQWVHVFEAAP